MIEKSPKNPPDMMDSGTKKPSKRESGKTLERRRKVMSLISVYGLNQTELSKRLGVDRSTIRKDLKEMRQDNDFWLDSMVDVGWVYVCQEMLCDTMEEIYNLKKMLENENYSTKEMIAINGAITHKEKFLVKMMKDLPLYHKMTKLSDWVQTHQN